MRRAKTLLALASAAGLVGVSAVTAVAAAPRSTARPESVREVMARLDRAIQEEMRQGCVETMPDGSRRFCGDSIERMKKLNDEAARAADELRARPADRRGPAMAAIRAFMRNEAMALNYVATSSNPYQDDSLMEIYADDRGNEYWIDPATDRLVQAGPGARPRPETHPARPTDRLPVAVLRERALMMVRSQRPDFDRLMSSLHPLEDNKDGGIYFFRWDDFSAPTREMEMPPFIQVGLMADGSFASFTNTLVR